MKIVDGQTLMHHSFDIVNLTVKPLYSQKQGLKFTISRLDCTLAFHVLSFHFALHSCATFFMGRLLAPALYASKNEFKM